MPLENLNELRTGVIFAGLAVLLLVETLHPFFGFFRSRTRARAVHAGRNLALGVFNGVIVSVVFAGLWVAAAGWSAAHGVGVLHLLGDAVALPAWAHTVLAVLLLDVWIYTWHRMNHRVPLLWRFHRVHHADAEMDVTTASRFHTGEIVLSAIIRVGIIALIGVHAWEIVLYDAALFTVVQFHHANIGLPAWLDRSLRAVIVTPSMHKVHHSHLQPETDSNYSSLFSWWDRLFGSFRRREVLSDIRFGLNEFSAPRHETLGGLVKMPFETPRAAEDH